MRSWKMEDGRWKMEDGNTKSVMRFKDSNLFR
jgi:hypothetical protein